MHPVVGMGTNVIKVKRPGGEPFRVWGPARQGEKIDFMPVIRNKRSLSEDLSDPEDLALVKELATQADVVVRKFRLCRRHAVAHLRPPRHHLEKRSRTRRSRTAAIS